LLNSRLNDLIRIEQIIASYIESANLATLSSRIEPDPSRTVCAPFSRAQKIASLQSKLEKFCSDASFRNRIIRDLLASS